MPGLEPLLNATDPVLLASHPENIQLWLPSDLPPTSRDSQCVDGLSKLEYRLRYAQALKALHDVRHFLRLTRALVLKRQSHIANTQRTKSRGLDDRVKMKLNQAVSTYRTSRGAIAKLAPNEEFGCWKGTLLELQTGDIRGPGHEQSETSESQFVQSWIWRTAPQDSASVDDPDLQTTLRVEWCKLQERTKRYEEEMELVAEEMRRTLVTFERNAQEWDSLATSPPLGDSAISAKVVVGIAAYAYKQADLLRRMIDIFIDDWYNLLEKVPVEIPWLRNFPRPHWAKRRRLVSNVQLYHSSCYTPQLDPSGGEITSGYPESDPPYLTIDHVEDNFVDLP